MEARKENITIHGIKESDSADAKERHPDELIYVMNMCHRQMNIRSSDESMIIKSFRLEGKKIRPNTKSQPLFGRIR